MTRIRPVAWLIAAVALFLLAVAGYALLVHASPQYYWKQIDTAVYRDGGIAVRNQPAMLYALELGAAKLPFTYTPFAALLFAAGSGASFATWQVGLAVLTIGLLPVVAYLSLGLAGRPAGLARAAAAFAIAAVGLWLEPVAMTLFFGQINLVLLALVVGDLALPDRIKGKGIRPFFCVNHGPTTSMYYRDPDGNRIELQIDNFATAEEGQAWMNSPAFDRNPIGVEFDPDALVDRFRAGVPVAELVVRD